MKEIKFKNINIVYNDKEISKKKIFINNFLMYSSSLLVVILMLTVSFILAETVINTAVATLLSLISSLAVLICGICLISLVLKKLSPKHFEFIDWVRKFKYNDFEFGLFNDRYIVQAHFPKGWETLSLKYFLKPEKSFKLIEDFEDKTKSLQIFVDCTKEETIVTVKNL